MPQNKVNSPVFVYKDSHQSLKHQYASLIRLNMVIICIQYIQQDLVFNNNIQFLLSLNDKAIRNIMNKYKITIICLFLSHLHLKMSISIITDGKGPRTVSYSICPNFDSLWLA